MQTKRILSLATAALLFGGCASVAQIERAQSTADEALQKAEQAQRTADEALREARQAKALAAQAEQNSKLRAERVLQKTQQK